MHPIKISDNSKYEYDINNNSHIKSLYQISNRSIEALCTANKNLLIFPHSFQYNEDKIESNYIFKLSESKEKYNLETNNIMGFIGLKKQTSNSNDNIQISISSRFEKKEGQDFFLHYMLEKVFKINLFNLKFGLDNTDSIFDFLIYLFPFYLKKALNQGLYREYEKKEYNNANIKGSINIVKHIQRNIPFNGKISYSVREYSFDNSVTELIRHTIEYIKQKQTGSFILNQDLETQNYVRQIIDNTPNYNKGNRAKIINKNRKKFSHPYFSEYKNLQELCMKILQYDKMKYNNSDTEVYGILFDGAWLWEEYLYTFLKNIPNLIHPENKTKKNRVYLFKGKKGARYPDYYMNTKSKIQSFVLDAKYKRLKDKYIQQLDRNDLHQIISYMYILQAQNGGFIYPYQYNDETKNADVLLEKEELYGYKGLINLCGIPIPSYHKNYKTFKIYMKEIEKRVLNEIILMINKTT